MFYAFSWRRIPVWFWPARRRPLTLRPHSHSGLTTVDLHIEFWSSFKAANEE